MDPIRDIAALLPHRPPFIMIGELLYADDTNTRTGYTIPANNLLIEGGCFSEAGLLENMAQTVAAGAGYRAWQSGQAVEPGFIVSVKNLEVIQLPTPAQRVITETLLKESFGNMIVIAAAVTLDDRLIARCEMNIFVGSQF